MKRFFFFVLSVFFSMNVLVAQITSVKVNANSESLGQNGVFYSLPRAVLQVDVIVSKINDVPGPYASYANQVLGLTDNINRNETTFAIKGVYIQSITEADPNAVYFLNFGERSSKADKSFLVQLQANGVLKGINESSPINEEDRRAKIELREDYFSNDFNYLADLNQKIHVDTIIRRMSVDTTSIEDVVYNRSMVEKSTLERAKDAANNYMEIHKNRIELLSGFQEVNYPAQTIEMMNLELRKMENDYLALFKGKRFVSEEKFSFYVTPQGDKTTQTYPLFRFSKERGMTDSNTSSGAKVNLMIHSNGITDILKNQNSGEQALGIFYRVPESAHVWVEYNNTELAQNTFIIPQLGVLQWVYTTKTILAIDSKTGMLKAIEIK